MSTLTADLLAAPPLQYMRYGWRMAPNGDMWFKRAASHYDGVTPWWSYAIDVAIIEAGTHRLFIRDTSQLWKWEIIDHEFKDAEEAANYVEMLARMEQA